MIPPGQMYCMHQLNLRPNLMEPVPWSCSNSIGPSQPRHLARHTQSQIHAHTLRQSPVLFKNLSVSNLKSLPFKHILASFGRQNSYSLNILAMLIVVQYADQTLGLAKCNWRSRKVHLVSLEVHCISSRPMHLLLPLPLHHNCTHLGMHQLDSENSRACCEFITDRQYIQIRLFCAARLVVE